MTVCCHTHSRRCLGLNCAALAHLLKDFDPRRIGAYVDTGHLVVEGEEFDLGLSMARKRLACLAFKDILVSRTEKNGHGPKSIKVVQAGEGMVDWSLVFETAGRIDFRGPVSVHCEFELPLEEMPAAIKREIAFLRRMENA